MGLYLGGHIIGRIYVCEIWGAYFLEGLFLEGVIIGILRYGSQLTPNESSKGACNFLPL